MSRRATNPKQIELPRSKIVITSRRPLFYYWQDPRIEFIAVDFLSPLEIITSKLRKVCQDVTHAYFTSYVHVADFESLRDKNVPLFQNFLQAIDAVAPSLQRVCLQTGCKVSPPDSHDEIHSYISACGWYLFFFFKKKREHTQIVTFLPPALWMSFRSCSYTCYRKSRAARCLWYEFLLRAGGLSL